MFFIFGLKTSEQRLGAEQGICPNCHNQAAQVMVRRSTKFSLFFIPLFPVKRPTYYATCTFCGTSRHADPRMLAGR